MDFIEREWTDAEKWGMGIVAALIVSGLVAFLSHSFGKVSLDIARQVDKHGRCVDQELLIVNQTKADAKDIIINFDVDNFTQNEIIEINYGDAEDQMITSRNSTLLKRPTFVKIKYEVDTKTNQLLIPQLQPNQALHIFYAGDTILDAQLAKNRLNSLKNKTEELMNKPQVKTVTMSNGTVDMSVSINC